MKHYDKDTFRHLYPVTMCLVT